MKKSLFLVLCFLLTTYSISFSQKTSPLYVDNQGVLRRTSTQQEVSYFGVNYTAPFAHTFRAAKYFNEDLYKTIDNDVYHFARLGFNAFRLHLWDVELSDENGNLIENEHLKALDYLIKKLEERKIDIILTAQTNFGNGYPEKNQKTSGFSYLYDQCMIHSDSKAIKAQENYLKQLAQHVNQFTKKSYLADTCIVAFEINNEPCHSISIEDTKNYINTMIKALKSTGYNKPIFYNVSHNHDFVSAYFSTEIDGGTYQWYPTGLVSGKTLDFNFLPYVDEYTIDFQDVEGFKEKAKIVYEFDPGDIFDTYLYPAVVRSFRSAGFQWITQFAYDATFLACYNTDYQTHYLNLAYTPGKAIGMKIASETSKTVPLYAKFPKYPLDTIFNNTLVSYSQNLAVYNSDEKFFYTNSNNIQPKNEKKLTEICGVGTSKIIEYDGLGAYFLDKLSKGVWRLEIMPDIISVDDAFEKPSFKRKVGVIKNDFRTLKIKLSDLKDDFTIEKISQTADYKFENNELKIFPGVYILKAKNSTAKISEDFQYNNIKVKEFFAPKNNIDKIYFTHLEKPYHEKGTALILKAQVVAPNKIDSVVVYPLDISFWRDDNKSIQMTQTNYYDFEVKVPDNWYFKGAFGYYILVYSNGQCTTFPSGNNSNPLSWDSRETSYYKTQIVDNQDKIILINSAAEDKDLQLKMYPDWSKLKITEKINMPFSQNSLNIKIEPKTEVSTLIYKDIRPIIKSRNIGIKNIEKIKIKILSLEKAQIFKIGFVDNLGITFSNEIKAEKNQEILEVSINELTQNPTIFLRDAYPTFLKKEFSSDSKMTFSIGNAAIFLLMAPKSKESLTFDLIGAWLE